MERFPLVKHALHFLYMSSTRSSSSGGTSAAKFRCAQCEMPETQCICDKYCCLCQTELAIRICEDGLMYCDDCRKACDYKTSD